MKKLTLLCLLATLAISIFAQNPSAASRRYHAYRQATTTPPYGLAKVKRLISRIKEDSDMNHRIPTKDFNALSVKEKFTYVMIHGEDFSQNCSEMPALDNEDNKIFAHPLDAFGDEAEWSERELAYLKNNRAAVIGLLRESIRANKHVGANLKQAIVQIDAHELIPDLVTAYGKDKQDLDLLSVMMILMQQGKYKPFLASASFAKLYGEKANWQAYLDANAENRKLIVDRVSAYYKTRKG